MSASQEHFMTNSVAIGAYVERDRHDTYDFIDPTKGNLSGKSVVITGASKGVGRATAISFAKAGCSKIAVAARSSLESLETELKKAAKEAGRNEPQVLAMKVDVQSEDSIKAAAARIEESFGAVDVLINNAGYLGDWNKIGDGETSEWAKTVDVNIKGLYLSSRYFIPLVLKSNTKTVLNISSLAAHFLLPGGSAYQATKFTVCRLTELMGIEYQGDGLVAIAVHPGAVKTELSSKSPTHMHDILIDEPELVADTLVWLGSEKRYWLTGRYVTVTWDMEELEKKMSDIIERDILKFRLTL